MQNDQHSLIEVDTIKKFFEGKPVLNDISLSLKPGKVLSVLGANGSGKTTLLKTLAGIFTPEQGTIFFPDARNTGIAYSQPAGFFFEELSVIENLRFYFQLCDSQSSLFDALDRWNLKSVSEQPLSRLSSGVLHRVALCSVWLQCPQIFLLDEPTAYLDQQSREVVFSLLQGTFSSENQDVAAVVATHDLDLLRMVSTEVIVLDAGEVVYQCDAVEEAIEFYLRKNR